MLLVHNVLNFVFIFDKVLFKALKRVYLALILLTDLVYITKSAFPDDFQELKVPNHRFALGYELPFGYRKVRTRKNSAGLTGVDSLEDVVVGEELDVGFHARKQVVHALRLAGPAAKAHNGFGLQELVDYGFFFLFLQFLQHSLQQPGNRLRS